MACVFVLLFGVISFRDTCLYVLIVVLRMCVFVVLLLSCFIMSFQMHVSVFGYAFVMFLS